MTTADAPVPLDALLLQAVGLVLHRTRCACSLPVVDQAEAGRFLELLRDAGYRVERDVLRGHDRDRAP